MALQYRPERIRELRIALGLNQAEFARRIRVSRQMVAFYEAGTHIPGTTILLRVVALTGAKLDSFFDNQPDSPSARASR
jgi:transcriptional regulator with XRE-family HTH domain